MDDFHGYPVRRITTQLLELECLSTAGPRIVGLRYKGSSNLLAEMPDIARGTPYGTYHYLGGHRLWHAPEAMPRTYIPDEDGLTISELPDGVILQGKMEPATGIRKRVEMRVDPKNPQVHLMHTLTNEGLWEVEVAPWAITMFRLGGIAILPVQPERVDLDALLPDRQFALWPYSHIDDARLRMYDEVVLLKPAEGMAPLKVGAFNPRGWMGYWLENILFVKRFTVQAGQRHPDMGCNAELYCNERFVELESLGPLQRLAPGESLAHIETWEFYDSLDQSFISPKMRESIEDGAG